MSKKNNVDVKLNNGNRKLTEQAPDMEAYKKAVAKGKVKEEKVRPAQLISRLDHSEEIPYGDSHIRVSPRSKEVVGDVSKIQADKLPKGIYIKKLATVKPKAKAPASKVEKE